MWKLVPLGALLVWCLGEVYASYDAVNDYWYSSDDGIILNSLEPIPLYRSHNKPNQTDILRTLENNTPADNKHETEWVLQFDKIFHNVRESNRRTPPKHFQRNPVLDRLLRQTTHAEIWRCTKGPEIIMDCNHCVCLGGQLYLCTAKKCRHNDESGKLVYRSYREKRDRDCTEGEKIKSFDCNRCWCSGGKITCTVRSCSDAKQALNLTQDQSCRPGESVDISLRDGCNYCGCNMRGEKYCTANSCGQGAGLFLPSPKVINTPDKGCVKETWYSLKEGSSSCKECYCLDGIMAFCYMKLCESEANSVYTPVNLMASVKSSTCTKGEVVSDECSRCVCTFKEEWKCYTRMIDKCSGMANENPQIKQKSGKYTPQTNSNDYDNISYDMFPSVEIDSIEHPNEYEVKKHNPKDYNVGSNNGDPHDGNSYQITTTKGYFEILTTKDRHRSRKPIKRPREPRKPINNFLPSRAECKEGESFTQSTFYNCQGCFCTADGKWKCFSFKDSCRGFDTRWCWAGAFEKNNNSSCSVCYCVEAKTWYCATDELCAQQIKKTNCNGVECSRGCQDQGFIYGICNKDKCRCV